MCICYVLIVTSRSEVPFVWERTSSVTMCSVGECFMVYMGERGYGTSVPNHYYSV